MSEAPDPRLYHPHVARNRDPILDVLGRVLPARALVLEIASGSGEHAAFFANGLPTVSWQPTDMDAKALASIAAFRANSGTANLLAPVRLDVTSAQWQIDHADAIVNCNMIHISPWAACEGLHRRRRTCIAGRRRSLLVRSLPHRRPSYRAEQRGVRRLFARTERPWGIRDLGDVTALAARHGLTLAETVPMPANNLSVIFRRAE